MPRMFEANPHALVDLLPFVITHGLEQPRCFSNVFQCVERLFGITGASVFSLLPISRILLLNMSAVAEHEVGDVGGGVTRDNGASKASLPECRQSAAMIDMRV